MTSQTESIARQYFDLSNLGKLEEIKQMFATNATYSSDTTGLYYGVVDIMTIMTAFFNAYRSLNWQINEIKAMTLNSIEIQFTFHSVDFKNQKNIRSGIERLIIDNQKIQHIEIRPLRR